MYTSDYIRKNLKDDWYYVPSGPYRAGLLTYKETTTVLLRHGQTYYCFIEDFEGVLPSTDGEEVLFETKVVKANPIYTMGPGPQPKYYRLEVLLGNETINIEKALKKQCIQ
jgi:hypothetical protein